MGGGVAGGGSPCPRLTVNIDGFPTRALADGSPRRQKANATSAGSTLNWNRKHGPQEGPMSKLTEKSIPVNEAQSAENHPTHEEIAVRAYQIYVVRGEAHGQDVDDWLQAERELITDARQKAKAATA